MRGRKPMAPTPVAPEPRFNEAALERADAAARELIRIDDATTKAARALAVRLGYEGPLTVAALEDQVVLYHRRSAEATLALGSSLLLLKELVPHGQFVDRLEALGIAKRTAQKLMSAAVKFSAHTNVAQLTGRVGSQAKLLELVILDDEELDVLAEGEAVRGVTLERIETMSTRELRQALREAEKEQAATEKRLEVVSRQKAEAETRAARIAVEPPDEALAGLHREATLCFADALGLVRGKLRHTLEVLHEHDVAVGREESTLFAAGLIGQLVVELAELRERFHLPDISNARDLELAAQVAQWAPKTNLPS